MNSAEERAIFYYCLGRALEQWAHAESCLEAIATACVSAGDRKAIEAGFNSIENFRSKLSFCDSLVCASVSDPGLLGRWAGLYARCSSLSATRNKLAHNRHRVFVSAPAGRRYALVSAKLGWSGSSPPHGSICVRDIESARADFMRLTDDLVNMFDALLGQPETYSASRAPPGRPPSLRELRAQIRAELGVQPGSLRPYRHR